MDSSQKIVFDVWNVLIWFDVVPRGTPNVCVEHFFFKLTLFSEYVPKHKHSLIILRKRKLYNKSLYIETIHGTYEICFKFVLNTGFLIGILSKATLSTGFIWQVFVIHKGFTIASFFCICMIKTILTWTVVCVACLTSNGRPGTICSTILWRWVRTRPGFGLCATSTCYRACRPRRPWCPETINWKIERSY